MTTSTLSVVYMDMGAGHWFLMALGLLVLVAFLLWVGSTLVGKKHPGGETPSEEVSALHLLDRRLAHGEITVEERDDARGVLAGGREHARA